MANLSNYNFVSGNTATFTGNIAGNYFIGNGSQLTGVPTIADLEAFLPTYNGNLNNVNTVTAITLKGEGGNIGNIQGANVTGAVANATFATTAGTADSVAGANVTGEVANAAFSTVAASANSVDGANVTGDVANATFATTSGAANSVDGANVSGPVANAVHALTSDSATVADSVAGANVTGQVANALVAGTVYEAAQPNITSLGTLDNVIVTGDVLANNASINEVMVANYVSANLDIYAGGGISTNGNVIAAGNVTANFFIGDGSQLTGLPAGYSNADVANYLPTYTGNLDNVSSVGNATTVLFGDGANITGLPAGYSNAEVSTYLASGTDTAGIITTGNIQAAHVLGNGASLSSLTGANVTGAVANATFATTAGTADSVAGANVTGTVANATFATTSGTADSVAGANVTGEVAFAATANSVDGGNVVGGVAQAFNATRASIANSVSGPNVTGTVNSATYATLVTTAIQSNITTLGTLTDLTVNSSNTITITGANSTSIVLDAPANLVSINQVANIDVGGNITTLGDITTPGNILATVVGNATTYLYGDGSNITGIAGGYSNADVANYLPTYSGNLDNINNLGTVGNINTLGDINASVGNITAGGNVSATGFSGNGAALSNIAGANVTGQVANALVSATVYDNAQPNITSVGTLTSLEVTGTALFGDANIGNLVVRGTTTTANVTDLDVANLTIVIASGANAIVANGAGLFVGSEVATVGSLTFLDASNSWNSSLLFQAPDFATTGNVTGAHIIGEGGNLSNITAANLVGSVPSATVADSANSVAGANVSGAVANATFATTAGTADSVAGANVTGEVAFAAVANSVDGGNVTGAVFQAFNSTRASIANSVSGANVSGTVGNATYAQIVTSGNQPNITQLGTLIDLTVTGNVTGDYFIGNGSQLTGLPSGYSNSDVSTYLASGTDTAGIVTTGDIQGNNIVADGALNVSLDAYVLGNMSVDATISAQVEVYSPLVTAQTLAVSTSANLGNVANIVITGGTAGQTLSTDGAGNLSWTTYGDANIAAYLSGGTDTTGFLTSGDVVANNLVADGGLSSLGEAQYYANVTINADANVTGNLLANNVSVNEVILGNYVSANLDIYAGGGISTNGVIVAAGNITGNYIIGNGSQLTGLPAGYTDADVSTYLISGNDVAGYDTTGPISSASLTTSGDVGAGGNLSTAGDVAALGNISGSYILGNGSQLTGLPTITPATIYNGTSNVDIASSNGNVTMAVAGTRVATISGTSILLGNNAGGGTIGANSIVIGPDTAVGGTGANAIVIGSQVGAFYQLNGIAIGDIITARGGQGANAIAIGAGSAGGGAISGGQGARAVAVGYQAGGGNAPLDGGQGANAVAIGANAGYAGQAANSIVINATGAALTTAAAGFVVAPVRNDTSNVTNVMYYNTTTKEVTYGPDAYGNTQVAAYLPTYTGNLGNVANIAATGNISANGNIIVNGTIGTGNISGANNISGVNLLASNGMAIGTTVTALPNSVATFGSNANSYTQITFQNLSNGADATSDVVLTADNGSDTVNFMDVGMINSGYDNATPTNSLGNIVFAADSYVYAQGNSANSAQSGGNLAIGATVPTKSVKIFAGGNNSNSIVATFSSTGVSFASPAKLAVYANTTVRDSSITSPQAGMMIYVTGVGMQVRGATSWNTIAGSVS